jgi:hypothetical protein
VSYAVNCHACEETVWPPHEATGPGGQTARAAYQLALDHIHETGHTEVYVTPGSYYIGDGPRPTAFGDGTTDPDDVAVSTRADLADSLDSAVRTLRDAGDTAEQSGNPAFVARHLRDMADALESHLPEEYTSEDMASALSTPNTELRSTRTDQHGGDHDG